MADIRLANFKGKKPYLKSEHLLGTSEASNCTGTVFESGLIRGVNDEVQAQAPDVNFANSVTLYQYPVNSNWYTWTIDVDIATATKSATDEVIMYTGDGEPRITTNALIGAGPTIGAYRTVGITAPTAAPTATKVGAEDADPSYDTRNYVYTWYDNVSGMESAPSPVSNTVTVDIIGQTVDVASSTTAPVDGTYNVTHKRIYRAVTGTATTDYQFVAEITLATGTYNDALLGDALGEVIVTEDFERPPTTMKGIVSHPAGFFCGFDGNNLCFSEPGFYYSWPVKYKFEVEYPIVGIAVFGAYLAVMTEGIPYIVTGTTPANMIPRKLDEFLPCVSKRSIVDMGGRIVYAAEDALVEITGQGARKLSAGVYTRDQWKALAPVNMFGGRWRNLYMAVYPTYIELWHQRAGDVGITRLTYSYESVWIDPSNGDVYFTDSTNAIQHFAGGASSTSTWTWISKPFMFREPINFACMRALGTFTGTVTLDEDDTAPSDPDDVYTYTTPSTALQGNTPIRLPSGIRYKGLRLTINGASGDELHELHLATSIDELPGTEGQQAGG
jgi:hypothetical protein